MIIVTLFHSQISIKLVRTDCNDLFPFPTVNQPTQNWLQWPIHIPDCQPTYWALSAMTYSHSRLLTNLLSTDCSDLFPFPSFLVNTIQCNTIQYNFIAKCQYTDCTRNVLWCQVHSFTPIVKHLITTAANKHPGKTSFIDNNMRKSHWHQAVHIT